MNDLQKKGIEQIINLISTHELTWIYFFYVGIIILSTILTWVLSTKKVKAEIDKLQAEKSKLQGELEKIKFENDKLKAETDKIVNENKKIVSETEKVAIEQYKVRQETANLSLDEKLKIISISASFEAAFNKYKVNIKQFEANFELFIEKTSQNANNNREEIRKITRFFDSEVIVVFAEYFKNWKAINKYNIDEQKEFVNLYLFPFFKLCSEFFHKFSDYGISRSELTVNQEVFRPMIEFGKNTYGVNENELHTNTAKICEFFDCQI